MVENGTDWLLLLADPEGYIGGIIIIICIVVGCYYIFRSAFR